MKIKCTLHVKPDQYEKDGFCYSVFNHPDMTSCGYTAVDTVEVEFADPPRDEIVKGAVAVFRKEQERIRAEMQARVNQLQEQINRLLALEHKPSE